MNFIDLFAGAGGLSEGFKKAGFSPIAHVELDKAACYTLRTRAVYHYLKEINNLIPYYSYLKGEISRNQLYSLVPESIHKSIINAAIGDNNHAIFNQIDELKGDQDVDLILGGPPCQAYSYIGRAALKHKRDDPRLKLYIHYGRFLKRYRPKLFVFENVPGLRTSADGIHYKNIKKYFKSIGYNLDDKLVNSLDFGVIQNRRRLILIGWRDDIDFEYPNFEKLQHSWTRETIFQDLPRIKANHTKRYCLYSTSKVNEYLRQFELRNGADFVTQHITRPHNERDLLIYKRAILELQKGKRLKNNEIPEEERTQKNVTDFLDRFKVVDIVPHTMIAHIAKDGHHFIHPDSKQLRSISIREAARIQSFSDDYYFEGVSESQPRTAAFKQIGNAVPPIMAYCIAMKLTDVFHE